MATTPAGAEPAASATQSIGAPGEQASGHTGAATAGAEPAAIATQVAGVPGEESRAAIAESDESAGGQPVVATFVGVEPEASSTQSAGAAGESANGRAC